MRVDLGKADVARLEAAAQRRVERHALKHRHRMAERNHAEVRVHANQTGAPQLGGRVRLQSSSRQSDGFRKRKMSDNVMRGRRCN